ncbi:hypothetical protein BB560_004396 [Smittium megazygosporum]|uniref:RPEL repeat protein n=1 Tax=Smittium megazygosporum TaxID=133381 RepID=A0A2T9Z9B3_9FUNG|nr:hypothetical protein BB560_004396 [Smittium megazygosporum]
MEEERRQSVKQMAENLKPKLERRPSVKELEEQNILVDHKIAPSLQTAMKSLMKAQVSDSLQKELETRPTREDLVKRNILKE